MNTLIGKIALALVLIGFTGTTVHAETNFKKKHPRRAEVNKNIRKERKEINQDQASGKITPAQAQADRQDLRNTKQNERADVKANGGHLTKDQQKGLNGELKANQNQINNQVNGNGAPAAPAAPASGN